MALLRHDTEWRKTVSSIKRLDRLWGPPNLLFSVYPGSFPGIRGRGVTVTSHLCLVLRFRMSASPLHLHGVDRDNVTFT